MRVKAVASAPTSYEKEDWITEVLRRCTAPAYKQPQFTTRPTNLRLRDAPAATSCAAAKHQGELACDHDRRNTGNIFETDSMSGDFVT